MLRKKLISNKNKKNTKRNGPRKTTMLKIQLKKTERRTLLPKPRFSRPLKP